MQLFLNDMKKQHIFAETCLYEDVEVSLSGLHFSLMFSEGEVKSPYFLQVWWALMILIFFFNFVTNVTVFYYSIFSVLQDEIVL